MEARSVTFEEGPTPTGIALLLGILVSLVLCLIAERRARQKGVTSVGSWTAPQGGRRAWIVAYALAFAANIPLLRHGKDLLGALPPPTNDGSSHAAIAAAIASHGLSHAWVETFNGGFPIGPHYPSVGWFLVALPIRFGVAPLTAISWIMVLATVAVPLLVVYTARAAGLRPLAAVAAALALAWVSPFNRFVGGWEPLLWSGLLSQLLAIPLVILWVRSLLPNAWKPMGPVVGALLLATHPQIGVAAFVVALPGVAIFGNSPVRERYLRSGIASVAVALAFYAPGIRTLTVPFGWPKDLGWRLLGFPPSEIWDVLHTGDLLDNDRPAVLTLAWLMAAVILTVRGRCRPGFAVLLASLTALFLSTVGPSLNETGGGKLLLSFIQPLRVLSIVPLAAAATIGVGVEVVARLGKQLVDAPAPVSRFLPPALLCLAAVIAVPSRAAWVSAHMQKWRAYFAAGECGENTPAGYQTETVFSWLRSREVGRVATGDETMRLCAHAHALESRIPIAWSDTGGAGAHVSVNLAAFAQLHASEPGSAARAEALGVRTLLHVRKNDPGEGWRVRESVGDVVLSERIGGTDTVGIGCIEQTWSGPDDALRDAVLSDLNEGGSILKRADSLIELVAAKTPLTRTAVPRGACDVSGVHVTEQRREPGAFEATVDAPHEVDVVIRASFFPSWRIAVDGSAVPIRKVAPGFVSARVPAGRHHIIAEAATLPGYVAGLAAALVVAIMAGFIKRKA